MFIKSLFISIFLVATGLAQTTYEGDLDNMDYSGLGPNGGVVTVTYDLTSGAAVSGLGSSFDLDISFAAWDNTYTWGVINNGFGPLFTVNETDLGFAQAVVTPTAAPIVSGWQLVSDELDMIGLAVTGFDPVTNVFWDSTMSPSPNFASHSDVRVVTYSASAGGPLSEPIGPAAFLMDNATLVYEQVPEPSGLLLCFVGALAICKRRR